MPTSLAYTLYLRGDYERLTRSGDTVIDLEPRALGLAAQGRRREALDVVEELDRARLPRVFGLVRGAMRLALAGDSRDPGIVEEAARAHTDPEALYMIAIFFAQLGRVEPALHVLERAVRGGFFVSPALRGDPLLAPLRAEPHFAAIVDLAEAGRREAQRRFESAGGNELLGL